MQTKVNKKVIAEYRNQIPFVIELADGMYVENVCDETVFEATVKYSKSFERVNIEGFEIRVDGKACFPEALFDDLEITKPTEQPKKPYKHIK